MGLQRFKLFFLLQISWIYACPDRRISLQFRRIINRTRSSRPEVRLPLSSLWSQLGLCAYRATGRVPPKPSTEYGSVGTGFWQGLPEVPTTWFSSYRPSSSQERRPPSIRLAGGTDCTTSGPSRWPVRLAGAQENGLKAYQNMTRTRNRVFYEDKFCWFLTKTFGTIFGYFLFLKKNSGENSSSYPCFFWGGNFTKIIIYIYINWGK
jgi:hypothetical protein